MLNGRVVNHLAALALALAFFAGASHAARAQEFGYHGGPDGPTVEQYLEETGPDVTYVEQGALKIDGQRVICGKRPTVLNPNFDSWGGAFPGFLILNTKKIKGLSTPVKLYIYSHECGHQFIGADEVKADLFAIRRGVKWGWLDPQGLDQICTFISQLKGDSVHPPGPKRCQFMRNYYSELISGGGQQASSTPPSRAQTLGPSF